jgi:4-aminobutyrate aminotransferase-like enzyme
LGEKFAWGAVVSLYWISPGVRRFAPPLTSSEEEIDFGLGVLDVSITQAVETSGN